MPYRLLIIDDEMPKSKGYASIEEWFPGAFEVHEARSFAAVGPDGQSGMAKLAALRFDLILLDFNLLEGDLAGPDIAVSIRLGPNAGAYIIGASDGWDGPGQRVLMRHLKLHGLERGLDGSTVALDGAPIGLRPELAKFLAARSGPAGG